MFHRNYCFSLTGVVWLLRLPPPYLRERRAIVRSVSGSSPSAISFLIILSSSSIADVGMQRFSLQFAVFGVFTTFSAASIGESFLALQLMKAPATLSSTVMLAGRKHHALRSPAPISGTGMLAGRRHLAAYLLQRRDTSKPHRVARSSPRHSG